MLEHLFKGRRIGLPLQNSQGFTLLELIISITLISILVLVLSMSLRTGIRAWTRGKTQNEKLVTKTAIESLLGRQLRAVVKQGEGPSDLVYFSGSGQELSFVTSHMPMGFFLGGMCQVIYRFDEDTQSLIYAQKIVTRREDIEEELPIDFNKDDAGDWLVSVIPGISFMEFAYAGDPERLSSEEMESSWEKEMLIPVRVAFFMSFDSQEEETSKKWRIFPTEPFIIN